MRVLLDATAGARDDLSGIGRYVHELVAALARLEVAEITLGVRRGKWSGRHHLPRSPTTGRPFPVRRLGDTLDRVRRWPFDLVHGLDARIPRRPGPPRVATLHDVFSLDHDDLARDSFRRRKQRHYAALAAEASSILCVSNRTRARWLRYAPDTAARCAVIHHGVSEQFAPVAQTEKALASLGVTPPYLLFVGLVSTRKEVGTLARAFDRIASDHPALTLVLAGKSSHGADDIARTLATLPHRDRIRSLGFVPDAVLPALYSAAEAFVFPSRDEGFGLPILEAFACGTAVVAADIDVVREVSGPLARRHEPGDVDDLARVLREQLARPTARGRAERLAHAAGFRWSETARRTWGAYRACCATSAQPPAPTETPP